MGLLDKFFPDSDTDKMLRNIIYAMKFVRHNREVTEEELKGYLESKFEGQGERGLEDFRYYTLNGMETSQLAKLYTQRKSDKIYEIQTKFATISKKDVICFSLTPEGIHNSFELQTMWVTNARDQAIVYSAMTMALLASLVAITTTVDLWIPLIPRFFSTGDVSGVEDFSRAGGVLAGIIATVMGIYAVYKMIGFVRRK